MGVKILQCFPWYGRRKEKKTEEAETPPPAPVPEKPRLHSTNSGGSDTDFQPNRAYFSGKARVSFRHEMDSTMNAIDSTY